MPLFFTKHISFGIVVAMAHILILKKKKPKKQPELPSIDFLMLVVFIYNQAEKVAFWTVSLSSRQSLKGSSEL